MKNGPESIPLVGSKSGGIFRVGSCAGDPQESALHCIKERNVMALTGLMADVCPYDDLARKENPREFPLPQEHWINSATGKEGNFKTLLHLALESGTADLVSILLSAGARADQYNDDLGLSPIHVACQLGNGRMVRLLCQDKQNKANVNSMMHNGRTSLHIAADGNHLDIMEFLLQQDDLNSVDPEDLMGRQTPMFLAAKKKFSEAVKMLLEYGADTRNTVQGTTIKDIIREKMPYFDIEGVVVKHKRKESNEQSLLNAVGRILDKAQIAEIKKKSNRQNLIYFNTLIQGISQKVLNTFNSGGMTLLQKSCDYGLSKFTEVLLDHGVDPNAYLEENSTRPVLLAAYRGHSNVLEVLKKHKIESVDGVLVTQFDVQERSTKETVLHYVLKRSLRSSNPEMPQKYQECLDILLDNENENFKAEIHKIINKKDEEENTALHYATQQWNQETVRRLLEIGANIGLRNRWDERPISKIRPETMEHFLDNFCLTSENDIQLEEFELTFNYSFLAPPVDNPSFDENDLEGQKEVEKEARPEMESLWTMSQSKTHRHLLKHPVITSFLWIKWHRIRKFFNRNVRLYLLFVMTLTWHIFEQFGGVAFRNIEDQVFNNKMNDSFCSDLSSRSGRGVGGFWYVIFILQSVLQFGMILKDWHRDISELDLKTALKILATSWLEFIIITIIILLLIFGTKILSIALTVLIVLVAMREMLQMCVSLKRYVFSIENWLEITVLILATLILYLPNSKLTNPCEVKRHLAAISIFLSWATLITLVGRHPKLSRCNVYVTMFYKVLRTFTFFLLWYSFFIIAFGLGFYIMLHKDVIPKFTPGDDDYVFFNNPWLSLVKTFTMFVGELEFSDIPVNLKNGLSPISYSYFITFIFLIVVVLMNLLNGLAVSDTGIIREKAEVITYISQVENISATESVLLGDPFNFLSNWPAVRYLKDLPSLAFCRSLYRCLPSFGKLCHQITGATGILLFYTFLPNKIWKIKPNKTSDACYFYNLAMGEIIEAAKNIVVKKNQEDRAGVNEELGRRIRNVEIVSEKMEKQMEDISHRIDLILKELVVMKR